MGVPVDITNQDRKHDHHSDEDHYNEDFYSDKDWYNSSKQICCPYMYKSFPSKCDCPYMYKMMYGYDKRSDDDDDFPEMDSYRPAHVGGYHGDGYHYGHGDHYAHHGYYGFYPYFYPYPYYDYGEYDDYPYYPY